MNKQEAKSLKSFMEYHNGYWQYYDDAKIAHLYKDDNELTEGITAIWVHPEEQSKGHWYYKDSDGDMHIMFNTDEVDIGVQTKLCTIKNGLIKYEDSKGFYHLIKDGIELTKGILCDSIIIPDSGDCFSYFSGNTLKTILL